MKYCNLCGELTAWTLPHGDTRKRHVCQSCHTIHYQNPNIVAGVIPVLGDQLVLCRRAIEPRYGLWTIPAGFMENGESVEEAATRESEEEANLTLGNLSLYTVTSLPDSNQVYMIFRANVLSDDFYSGEESLETKLFSEEDLPWDELAFRVVEKSLEHFFNDRRTDNFVVRNLVYHKKSSV